MLCLCISSRTIILCAICSAVINTQVLLWSLCLNFSASSIWILQILDAASFEINSATAKQVALLFIFLPSSFFESTVSFISRNLCCFGAFYYVSAYIWICLSFEGPHQPKVFEECSCIAVLIISQQHIKFTMAQILPEREKPGVRWPSVALGVEPAQTALLSHRKERTEVLKKWPN